MKNAQQQKCIWHVLFIWEKLGECQTEWFVVNRPWNMIYLEERLFHWSFINVPLSVSKLIGTNSPSDSTWSWRECSVPGYDDGAVLVASSITNNTKFQIQNDSCRNVMMGGSRTISQQRMCSLRSECVDLHLYTPWNSWSGYGMSFGRQRDSWKVMQKCVWESMIISLMAGTFRNLESSHVFP